MRTAPVHSLPSARPSQRDRTRWPGQTSALAGLLTLAVLLAYGPAYPAGFIWDDDLHVTANPVIVGPLGLREIWTTPAANYFPLTMTTFWVLHALFGLNPLPYHVFNVGLHLSAALLLWATLRKLGVRGAWFGAALWALHPVQVESVAWISELKNTQSAVFFLLAAWFFARRLERVSTPEARDSGWRDRDHFLALGCGALAMLSKSSTVMLPAVLLVAAWWRTGRWSWRTLAGLLPLFVLALVISAWTVWEQKVSSGAQGEDWSHSLAERLVIAGQVPWFYLGKLLWPEPLIFIYPRWNPAAANPASYLPLLAALLVAGVLYGCANRARWARDGFFAAAAFGILLFPVLGLFDVYFFRFSFVGDHLQYLASMAPLALLGALLAAGPARSTRAGAIAMAAVFGFLSWRQAQVYRSDLTLFADTVAHNPAAWMARSNLGHALLEAGRVHEALAQFRTALELRPRYPEAEMSLGRALTEAGRPAEALPHLERALQLLPGYADAHNQRGIALIALGRTAEGIAEFETVLRAEPGHVLARFNLGLAFARLGRPTEAIRELEELLRRRPAHAEAATTLGLTLAVAGRPAEARSSLERGVHLAPRSAAAHSGYGRALLLMEQPAEAVERFATALQLRPDAVEDHLLLAEALQRIGRAGEAEQHRAAAARLAARPGPD